MDKYELIPISMSYLTTMIDSSINRTPTVPSYHGQPTASAHGSVYPTSPQPTPTVPESSIYRILPYLLIMGIRQHMDLEVPQRRQQHPAHLAAERLPFLQIN